MELETTSTKKAFESLGITLSDYWLESCIEWFRDENPNTNYSLDTLHLKVYQQWMLLDLRDVEISILPRNLPQQTKYVLNGTFPLQIMHITDVSRPKLWQLQRIRNRTLYNHSTADQDNPNSKRCLLLLLTDGVTEIEAIEYSPIKNLNINLPPGTKIKLIGPVTVRKGQLFLEEKHVQVLGGEVEELLVSNAPENILARALNLPENPNPNSVEELNFSESTTQQTNVSLSAVQVKATNNVRVQSTITNFCQQNQPKATVSNSNFSSVTEDEEMRMMSEIDMLMEAERDVMLEIETRMKNEPKVQHMEQETRIKNEPKVHNEVQEIRIIDEPKVQDVVQQTKNEVKDEVISLVEDDFEAEESIFEDVDIDAHLDMLDEQLMTKIQTVVIPRVSLGDLTSMTPGKNDKFLIKAKLKRVLEKLNVTDNYWVLKVLLEDGTSELEAFLHTDIVTKLMGYSPSGMMAFRKDVKNKNAAATTTTLKILEDFRQKVMKIDGLMEITYFSQQDCPSITELK